MEVTANKTKNVENESFSDENKTANLIERLTTNPNIKSNSSSSSDNDVFFRGKSKLKKGIFNNRKLIDNKADACNMGEKPKSNLKSVGFKSNKT